MTEHSTDQPSPEMHENPFEGLEVLSTGEDLALAMLEHRLGVTDEDDRDYPLRTYQLAVVKDHLAKHERVAFGVDSPAPSNYRALVEVRKELEGVGGLTHFDLEPQHIIEDATKEARWLLSGLDPNELKGNETQNTSRARVETAWKTGAEAHRKSQLAALEAQDAELDAQDMINTLQTGEKRDSAEARATLRKQAAALRRSRDSAQDRFS